MSNLKKKSLFLLIAMIVLIAIPMSFASDVDDQLAVDDDSDIVSVTDDIDQISDVGSEELGSTPEPDNGAFVYLGTDSAEINDGESVTISGEIRYSYGMGDGGSALIDAKFPVTCKYEDINGDIQEYSTTSGTNGKFTFDTSSFTGLIGKDNPYTLTISATDADDTALDYTGSANILSATYTLTITPKSTIGGVNDISSKIDAASSGAVIDLSDYETYDFGENILTISKDNITLKGNGNTVIKGHGYNGKNTAMFIVNGKNVVFQGIVFENTNPNNNMVYGGSTAGTAIRAQSTINTTIKDCTFTDFDQAIRVQASNGALIENNKFNGGYATCIVNDPTVNVESGSKTVSVGGSTNVIIINNTFDGPMLDALSLFGGSGGNNLIADNTFIGNAYAIYFGGASTKGSVLRNNTFINCGQFKKDGQNWIGLPIISIQKSSDGISIIDNKFEVVNGSVLISAEAGNTAHGSATKIGNINITGNIVTSYESDVNMSSVTLFNVFLREDASLEMDDAIIVKDNVFPDGVKGISVKFYDGKELYSADESTINQTIYPEEMTVTLYNTTIEVNDMSVMAGESGNLIITLKASNGYVLKEKTLMVAIDGNILPYVTDSNGVVSIPIKEDAAAVKYVTVSYLGEGSIYKASVAGAKITVNAKPTTAPVTPVAKKTTLTAKKATLKVKKVKKIKVTLKSEGKAVAGKYITIKVNKKTFKAKTNSNGVATIKVKVTKKGKFTAVVKFAGDSSYKSVSKKVKFTVKK